MTSDSRVTNRPVVASAPPPHLCSSSPPMLLLSTSAPPLHLCSPSGVGMNICHIRRTKPPPLGLAELPWIILGNNEDIGAMVPWLDMAAKHHGDIARMVLWFYHGRDGAAPFLYLLHFQLPQHCDL